MYILILLLLFILTVSAFFASAETALTVASKAKIHRLSKKGNMSAKLAEKLQEKPGDVISSLLAGNALFNAIFASVVGSWSAAKYGPVGKTLFPILSGAIILIYCEVLPKMIALNYSEEILINTSYILKTINKMFKPLTHFVNLIAAGILRLFGLQNERISKQKSFEELRGYIEFHMKSHSVEARSMLTSILDLEEVEIGEIMIHRQNVKMVNADSSFEEIIKIARSTTYTRLPVWKNNSENIVGILNVKSLIEYIVETKRAENFNLFEVINIPWFVPESTNLLEQLRAFRVRKEHMAIVVDEYGVFMGIVTLEDILEEIVGDINDEHDIQAWEILKCADGSCIIPGTFTIRDLNRKFDWDLPNDDAATLGGLLINTAQDIPDIGEIYEINGIRFEVIQKHKHHLTLIKIIPPISYQQNSY